MKPLLNNKAFFFAPFNANCLFSLQQLGSASSTKPHNCTCSTCKVSIIQQTFPKSLVTSKELGRYRNKGDLASPRVLFPSKHNGLQPAARRL